MANEVIIKVKADTDKAERGFKDVGTRLQSLTKHAKTAGVAFAAIGVAGTVAIKSFVAAAMEQRRAVSTLAAGVNNLGISFASVEKRIMDTTSALQRKTNFGDEQQIRALALMVPILGSVDKALEALPAVMDAASASGKSLETVSGTLTRALSGQVNQAISIGMNFDKTATFGERLAKVLAAVGGAAAANRDPFIGLNMAVGDLKETLGEGLLPVLIPIVEKLTEVTAGLTTMHPESVEGAGKFILLGTALAVVLAGLAALVVIFPAVLTGLTAIGVSAAAAAGVVGVGALIAALYGLGQAWDANLFDIKGRTETGLKGMLNGFGRFFQGMTLPLDSLITRFNDIAGTHIPTLSTALDKLGNKHIDFGRRVQYAEDRSRLLWDTYKRSLPVGADWGDGGPPDMTAPSPSVASALPSVGGMGGGTGGGAGGISIATGGGGGGSGGWGGYGNLNDAMKIFADPRSESGDWTATQLKATGIGGVWNDEFGRVTMPRTTKAKLELAGRDIGLSIGNTFEDDMENYEGI